MRISRPGFFAVLAVIGALVIGSGLWFSTRPWSRPTAVSRAEWWKDHHLRLPFPNTLKPNEILSNIKAIGEQTKLGVTTGIPGLVAKDALRVRRVLQARMELGPPEYLVVELDDLDGLPAGVFVMTREGVPILISPPPVVYISRPLDLSDVSTRVEAYLGRRPVSSEYFYFHNTLERGISLDRPLAVVTTERGLIYFNSEGEAFVEEHTPLADLLHAAKQPASTVSNRSLVSVGRW